MTDASKTASPFVVGATVARVTRYQWSDSVSFVTVKIAKVYKNGNFVLEDDTRRWRPFNLHLLESSSWTAHRTGHKGYDSDSVAPITPELIEEANKTKLRARLLVAIETISEKRSHFALTEELVAQFEVFAALVKVESKS